MEIGGIKKKDRVVSVKVTKGDVESRIKSNETPFAIQRNLSSSTSRYSNISLKSSRSQAPLQVPSGHRLPTSRNCKEKNASHQYQEPRRPCEHYDRFIAPNPKQKRATKSKNKMLKAITQQENPDGKISIPENINVPPISYNRTIIDHFEKYRYSHPNYNVNHLVNFVPKQAIKIDARYGD